jgi:hypothetical protein
MLEPSKIPELVSHFFGLFLKRILAQKIDIFRDLGRGRPHFAPFPKIYRSIVNMKVEGKLTLGELQVQPQALYPIAPGSANIRVFLPVDRFFRL